MGDKPSKEYIYTTNCCVDKDEIKKLRKSHELELTDVSKKSGITRTIIWKMESYGFGLQLCQFKKMIETYDLKLKIVDSKGNEYNGILREDNDTISD